MSGTSVTNNPNPRALFDRLIGEKSSGLVLRDGEVVSNGKLSFNSGLHSLGFKKSEEDIQSNQKTMKYLLNHISEHVTEDEMQYIMESKIRLGTEKEGYTVRERLERGTYISSDLVKQLRVLSLEARIESTNSGTFREVDIGANPIHSMMEGERRQVSRHNTGVLDYTFGEALSPNLRRDREAHQKGFRTGTVSEMALTKFGERSTPVQDAIAELCRDGTKTNSAGETDVWNSFKEFWTRTDLPEEQETERTTLINEFRRRVDSQVAELSAKGLEVTSDDVKAMLKEHLASPQQMMKFEQETKLDIEERESEIALETAQRLSESNDRLVETMGPDGLGRGIQQWLTENPQFQESGQKLLQDLVKVGDWTRDMNLTPQDLPSIGEIEARMRGEQPGGSPLELTDKLREGLKAAHTANPAREALTDQHIGKLLDGTLREILTPRPQPPVNEELQSKLNGDIEEFFPSLGDMVSKTSGNTIGEKTGNLLNPKIEELSLKQAVQTARQEGKDLSLPDVQREVAENAMQMIAKHREMQERVLPVLDDHVALQRELDSLSGGAGGLPGVDRDTLLALDARSDQLKAMRQQLEDYKNLLNTDFGGEIEGLSGELDLALMEMGIGDDYDTRSARQDREYAMRVEQRLGELSLQPIVRPEIPGVSKGLNGIVALFPGLRTYVQTLSERTPNFDTIGTLSELVNRAVWQQSRARIEKEVRDENTFFVDGKVKEALLKFENQWTAAVGPRLAELDGARDEFGPLPPPPPAPMTVESIEEYRQSLTHYIETGSNLSTKLEELGDGFQELHEGGLISNLALSNAMYSSVDIVGGHVRSAQLALDALQR